MWMDAVNRSALEDYADLVAEDLVWLPPVGDPIIGRGAFRAWLEPFFERFEYRFSVDPTRVRRWEGWCAEHGHFRSELFSRSDGQPQEHVGRYFVLWRRDPNGKWRIERYVDETREGDE